MPPSHIPVTFDKSHIVTIGERLYGESLELLRELISNAYDADAENVWVEVHPDWIMVRDDGAGMDASGLHEYFTIGSQNKIADPLSPRFRRRRIGQFGIGKFAVLTACERFTLRAQHEGFAAEVIFDKTAWGGTDSWNVPMESKEWDPERGNGTTVLLEKLKKEFMLPDCERYIRERLPLQAPHFQIFLNEKRIEPVITVGRKFPVALRTMFGEISGEIILPNVRAKSAEEPGVECVVRGVVVCRSTFGSSDSVAHRLRGRISADFLPITSDRTRFITDSPEYRAFVIAMTKEIKHIGRIVSDLEERKSRIRANEALRDSMTRFRRAIRRNPDIAPSIVSATGEIDPAGAASNDAPMAPEALPGDHDTAEAMHASVPSATPPGHNADAEPGASEPLPRSIRVKNLLGKTIVARAIMIGGVGITCALEPCGPDQPAAFTEGGIVYINTDHPLYGRQQQKGGDLLGFYLTYLLSQQVALMFAGDDARKALAIQDRLLTDSW